jgi:AraC-like DNA-binding protein
MSYPPGTHPKDHALSWDRGRVLHDYQLIFISQGEGRFESADSPEQRIGPGMMFILFPNVWHRYQPTSGQGWVEDWIELSGATLNRLARSRLLSSRRPVMQPGARPEIVELFGKCHMLARNMPAGYQPMLALVGLQILANALSASAAGEDDSEIHRAVRQGQSIIAQASDRRLDMRKVAEEVGMSYSSFRRAFRAQTGVAPKQYHVGLRLRKAQSLLTLSSMSLKQIADALGYDSAFHLSADFKARIGMSPALWRSRLERSTRGILPLAPVSGRG